MRKRLAIGLLGLVSLAVASCSCAERRAIGVTPVDGSGKPEGSAAPLASALPTPAAAPASRSPGSERWIAAVRLGRWEEASALLDALPEAERNRPEIRYVRGRAALAGGQPARAVELFTGLEKDLPDLADDITRRRAEAAAEAGPFADAASYFAKSPLAGDLLRAALAHERDGKLAEARAMVDRALVAAQRGKKRGDEVTIRAARARLYEAQGALPQALFDLRWLAVEAAGRPEGKSATEALERLARPLTDKEKLASALVMIKSGSAAEALPLLDTLAGKPGIPPAEIEHARAEALMKSRDYAAAEKAYREAALRPGPRQAEELYQAATALARAGHPDEAIKRYLDLSGRFRKNNWAERALYQASRWLLLRGRYDESKHLYTRYLSLFPRGAYREDAEYEQALALLSAGDHKAARKKLAGLARDEKRLDEAQKLRELEGLAAFRAGDRDGAVRIWTEVARTLPLSFAALAARARLTAAGAPLPPLLEPSTPQKVPPLELALPGTAALLASVGLDVDAEGRLAAVEREATARYAGREGEALCGMYGLLGHARRRYRVGVANVGLPSLLRAPGDADRWTWECLYPRPYADEVQKLEEEHAVPRGLVHALMRQESAFDQEALSPVSAAGLMQLMPQTARKASAEISMDFDPARLTSPGVNLRLGAFYVGKLLKTFRGNPVLAVAAYNAGPKAVGQWIKRGVDADADLWVARIPYDETRNYVARVLGNFARYQWLEGGDAAVASLALEVPVDVEVPADAY
ncbi:transglycosylase SLT domain-containing protein [Polyangium aurulentum]|uniref:lytic transglycosylase domain-containing protein n=1 Tax=Polyangium aurulentum TaxID=2567896 RepID=UPI0010AE8139|nr:transglycosylase SLT domain-containing protein [Polyangium aurulentum]UQA59737.1 transglycosylase SLT domain-containing protein [Polyangium aurulentum]